MWGVVCCGVWCFGGCMVCAVVRGVVVCGVLCVVVCAVVGGVVVCGVWLLL